MTGRRLSLLLATFLFFSASANAAVPVIVKVLPGANISLITNLLGGVLLDTIPGANTILLKLPNLPVLTFTLRLLGVEWLEADKGLRLPSNPPLSGLTVPLGTASNFYKYQPSLALIRTGAAHQYSTGQGQIIADINSSVDFGHPAIAGHLTSGYDFVSNRPTDVANLDDDQSTAGFLDDDQSTAGFLDDDQSTAGFLDGNGISLFQSTAGFLDSDGAKAHGTFCVGILAVVAPNATIMPLRAFDDNGNSDLFTLAKAIRYAKTNGATIINMSWGTLTDSKVIKDAIDDAKNANILLVASAGNNNTSSAQYPAAYPGVIAVAATNINDVKTSFSNFGTYVFVDAPGEHIISATPNGKYSIANGTSFSAPMVAGMAALIRSVKFTSTSAIIASSVVTIDAKNPQYAGKLGYGRVDVLQAVKP